MRLTHQFCTSARFTPHVLHTHAPQMQQLRTAAREGRERSHVFNTSVWAGYMETGASMALQLGGGGFVLVPSRAAEP